MRFSHVSLVIFGALAAAACSDQNSGNGRAARADQAPELGTSSLQVGAATTAPVGTPRNQHRKMAALASKASTRGAIEIDQAGAQDLLQKARYERDSQLSPQAKADVHKHRARSVPHFAGSYTLGGQTYPYTMVGHHPEEGGTTRVKTTILPVSLFFDEFADANGNNIQVDVAPSLDLMVQSPNFLRAPYGTGYTQFSDAIQRAEFWNVMGDRWHTLLEAPRMQKAITLEVPAGAAKLYHLPNGAYITYLDQNFFFSQFNTIIQLADFNYDELALLLTPNVFLSDGNPQDGVILGFHTAWDAENPESPNPDPGTAKFVQTFAWASWIEPGVFRGGFSDVTALSHEIAEWVNDPFVDNATQNWAFPGTNGQFCQNNLETGDPVEVLPNAAFPVTLHGFNYHPQTEALLQWFSQETPSSAFSGAYSYPDTKALPIPSENCAHP